MTGNTRRPLPSRDRQGAVARPKLRKPPDRLRTRPLQGIVAAADRVYGAALDLEFLQDYLIESRELLVKAQRDILSLETEPGNDETLASIFRAFHTLKGGAGFLDAKHVVSWAHDLENLLDKLRSHNLPVTSTRIDAILNALDVLNDMLQTLAEEEYPGPGPADLGRTIQMLSRPESESGGSLAAIASAITGR